MYCNLDLYINLAVRHTFQFGKVAVFGNMTKLTNLNNYYYHWHWPFRLSKLRRCVRGVATLAAVGFLVTIVNFLNTFSWIEVGKFSYVTLIPSDTSIWTTFNKNLQKAESFFKVVTVTTVRTPLRVKANAQKRGKKRNDSLPNGVIKRILFWNQFFYHSGTEAFCLSESAIRRQKEICKYQCEFTANRSLIHSSHAVVFHGRDLHTEVINKKRYAIDMPNATTRIPSQPWIVLMLESPFHAWTDLPTFEKVFNWTMTYRTDSDIYIPYGKIDKIPIHQRSNSIRERTTTKTRLVAWIASNRKYQPSKRNEFVKQLQKHIRIDIYGKKGAFNCSKSNFNICENLMSCYEEIGKNYKFYLAFENSLCQDYITEKPFNALLADMVPVVYGYANYSNYLPNHSYINAGDFESAEALAKYLHHLDKNPKEYLKYFEWKKTQVVVKDSFYLERAWCSLCTRLSVTKKKKLKQKKIVSKLNYWWNYRNGSKVCILPTFLN